VDKTKFDDVIDRWLEKKLTTNTFLLVYEGSIWVAIALFRRLIIILEESNATGLYCEELEDG